MWGLGGKSHLLGAHVIIHSPFSLNSQPVPSGLFLVPSVLVPWVSVALLRVLLISSSTLVSSKLLQSIPLRENFLILGCKPLLSFKPLSNRLLPENIPVLISLGNFCPCHLVFELLLHFFQVPYGRSQFLRVCERPFI